MADLPGAKNLGGRARQVDDGGFNADSAGTTIKHRHALTELVTYVLCRGRADAPEFVGRGRRNAATKGMQQLACAWVRGHAQSDGVLTASDCVGYVGVALEDHGQRTGPKPGRQRIGAGRYLDGPARYKRHVGYMHDQRMIGRPPLGREDLGHRLRITRIGRKAIDRFSRDRHQLAGTQQRHGLRQFEHAQSSVMPINRRAASADLRTCSASRPMTVK